MTWEQAVADPAAAHLARPSQVQYDWPQFRGPDGQGHAATDEAPVQWSESENVAWKVPVEGRGWSSPLVLGDRVWMTTAVETPGSPADLKAALERVGLSVPNPYVAGSVKLKAICIHRDTGRLIRAVTLLDIQQPEVLCATNSYASPTPVAEPGRLYCDFGAMGTMCLDTDTGEIIWSRRLDIEHSVGPGSSAILYGDLLVLTRDGCYKQYATALDKQTGETAWTAKRPPLATSSAAFRKAFSTPLVFQHDGSDQMVAIGAQWMVSYAPATGRELWRVDTGPTFSTCSRPVSGCGLVFCCTYYGGQQLLAIRPDGGGDVTQSHVQWRTKRSVPKLSSPLVVGDKLYMVSGSGVASCLDARTGDVHWTERLGGAYSASPVHAGGRIYFFSEEGTTHVLRSGEEFASLGENSLNGRVISTPAFVDGVILLRTETHLYCIRD